MGLFDKVKHFMGGHGCKVEILEIEGQPPAQASLPRAGTVVQGRYRITAEDDVTVLSHTHRFAFRAPLHTGEIVTATIAEDVHDETREIAGSPLRWPYELKAGERVEDRFILQAIDVDAALRKKGDPAGAQFLVIVEIDVKNSPVDPLTECRVQLA